MPSYTFACKKCKNVKRVNMSISAFLKNKDEKKECSVCDGGVLYHKLGRIDSRVDKNSTEIIDEIKESVYKTVDKVYAGDQRTIDNIYGDKVNPHKK